MYTITERQFRELESCQTKLNVGRDAEIVTHLMGHILKEIQIFNGVKEEDDRKSQQTALNNMREALHLSGRARGIEDVENKVFDYLQDYFDIDGNLDEDTLVKDAKRLFLKKME